MPCLSIEMRVKGIPERQSWTSHKVDLGEGKLILPPFPVFRLWL
jgi:hypothetical protein